MHVGDDILPGSMSFIDNPLDRQAFRRSDVEWLQERLLSPDARIVVTNLKHFLFEPDMCEIGLTLDRAEALGISRDALVFLGQAKDGSRPVFAGSTPLTEEEVEARRDIQAVDLRTLAIQNLFRMQDVSVLAQARALLHWHHTHPFCARCGQPTKMEEAGYRRGCVSCGAQHFPRTDPAVIMLITDGPRLLLGRPKRLEAGFLSTLAGFMEPGETFEQAVRRETMEEAGIEVGEVQLLGNQPWPFPANLMVGCIGEALTTEIHLMDDELDVCRWCTRDEVAQMIEGSHPSGDRIPPALSIASWMIKGWRAGTFALPNF